MEGYHLKNAPTNRTWDILSMGRLAGPGHHPYIPHGRELFPSATSSYTHSHPIDFINPDSHLLGKKMIFQKNSFKTVFWKILKMRTTYISKGKPCRGPVLDTLWFKRVFPGSCIQPNVLLWFWSYKICMLRGPVLDTCMFWSKIIMIINDH